MEVRTLATSTDTLWTERLQNVVPDNFSTNRTTSFTAKAGILENMINRIGRTIIAGQPNAYNPFNKWTRPVMDYGDTIQQYTLPYISGYKPDFDPADPNPFSIVKPTTEAQYWQMNDAIQYKQSIQGDQLKKAFVSADTYGSFTSTITQNMYESVGIDMFLKWKKYISSTDYIDTTNGLVSIDADTTTETGQNAYGMELWKTLKDIVTNKLKYPTTLYNKMDFLTSSPSVDVVITTEAKNMMDNALAGVYNVNQIVPPGLNFIEIDSFATVTGQSDPLDCIVLTSGMASYVPRTPESGSLYNPENLITNLWYTQQGLFMIDQSKNAMQIYRATA